MPLGRRQSCLTLSCARAFQRADGARAEMPSHVERLIESAGAASGRMKGNRNHEVRPVEYRAAVLLDEHRERSGE